MKVPTNTFKRALREGRRQIGLWSGLCSPVATEILADAGFDWILIDAEHAPNEPAAVADQLRALRGGTASAVVRPPWNDVVQIKRLLDVGTESLLVPFVQNAQEAARAVAATRYPPRGIRGAASVQRANRYGRVEDYFKRVHDELCVLVQIETVAAVAALEDIAAVEGVDGVFIGPTDLAASLGRIGDNAHPEVQALIADACGRATRVGKPIGILAPNESDARRFLEMGFLFVAVGSDLVTLRRGVDALVEKFRT